MQRLQHIARAYASREDRGTVKWGEPAISKGGDIEGNASCDYLRGERRGSMLATATYV